MTDMPTQGAATVEIAAPPQLVWALLTDLDVLPTFSPENERCELLGAATELAAGVRFRGHNRAGDYEWHADCEVTVFEPLREFTYVVPPGFEHATTWRYTIEVVPGEDGPHPRVTESFDAPLLALPDVYPGRIEGRCENLRRACETTLANLKLAAESAG